MNDNNNIETILQKGMIHNTDMEKAVLSAFLTQSQPFGEYKEILTEDCFYDPQTNAIFKAIKEIVAEGNIPDMILVSSRLAKNGSKITASDITKMVFSSPANPDTYAHANLLRDYAMRRELWKIGYDLLTETCNESFSVASIHNDVKERVDSLFDSDRKEMKTLEDSYKELQRHMIANSENPQGSIRGTKTGFDELDSKGGLCGGDLIVVGAETSQGKTSFATALAVSAVDNKEPIAFYSMEMTTMQLTSRIVAMRSGITSSRILNDSLTPEEIYRIDESMANLNCSGMFFDENSTSSLDVLLMSIRAMKSKHDIKGAVVDYLQLVDNKDKNVNVEQATAISARKLKNLAKELDIWIIAISQLSRNPQNPFPTKSRLRNSGQIEEAADTIILIYRPEGTKFTYPEPFADMPTKGTAMVIIDKGRNVGTGSFICGFNGANTLFYPLDKSKVNALKTGIGIADTPMDPNNPDKPYFPF